MRIIPKKIKVKNTVWKCYSMPDVIVALVMFALIFAFITTEIKDAILKERIRLLYRVVRQERIGLGKRGGQCIVGNQ